MRFRIAKFAVRYRKKIMRYSLVSANLLILGVVVYFVTKPATTVKTFTNSSLIPDTVSVIGPLDQVSSADIAVNIARITGLTESVAVANHADSISATEASAPTDASVVSKPQVVASSLPSYRDIQEYTTVAGDTVASLAVKFGVSSESIRWSNSLGSGTLPAGKNLLLPPVGTNGIVYTVVNGDTAESLARRYSTSEDLIISFNDAETLGLTAGRRILIPNGTVTYAPVTRYNYYAYTGGGGSYSKGWCTDYASARGGAPGGWGNANTWAIGASRTPGWVVSKIPRPGAIAHTTHGWAGHVGIVDAVSEDGTMIKYSDMNGIAGWGRVGYSDWVPTYSVYQNFIHRQ